MAVTRLGYRTIAISLYDDDLERADRHVAELKARGYRRMGRSQLIRLALLMLDTTNLYPPEEVPSKITSRPPTSEDILATQQAGKVRTVPWSPAYESGRRSRPARITDGSSTGRGASKNLTRKGESPSTSPGHTNALRRLRRAGLSPPPLVRTFTCVACGRTKEHTATRGQIPARCVPCAVKHEEKQRRRR
jgi:hypothetical protein